MKKLYSTLAILCILMAIPATSTAQFKFGIKGGANFSEAPKDFTGIKEGHNGWYAGPMIKFTIPAIGLGLEANALYCNAARAGKKALCICTVSDNFLCPEENATVEERQNSFTDMMEVALGLV